MSAFFYRISKGWVALAGLLIFLVFSLFTLPAQSLAVTEYDQGMGSPDTSFFYDAATIQQMAEAYGETGRNAYVHARWTFDLAFPFVYTFFLLTAVSFGLKRVNIHQTRWSFLNLTPLLGFIFDLSENASASAVMSAYPNDNGWAAVLAPIFTPLKWVMIGFAFMLLLYGLGRWLFDWICRRKAFNKDG